MKTEEITTFQPQILNYLRGRIGDIVSVKSVAKYLKVGEASVMHIMLNMELDGLIRKGRTSKGTLGFFLPSREQLASEEAAAGKSRLFKKLRSDPQKLERLEEIKRQRELYKSIG
jgi:hypothetical protein